MSDKNKEKNKEKNEEKEETIDLVRPDATGFVERITPKELPKNVFLFKCSCGGEHFRHAGYISTLVPFLRSGGEKRIGLDDYQTKVCVKCRKCYAWINEQMYDVTEHIDLEAWQKAEVELNKATGPGGEC